jgi:hypothetical protein
MPMPGSEFNDPILEQNGDLKVSGPFKPEVDDFVGEVLIRFLVIQEAQGGGPAAVVQDLATWKSGDGDNWEKLIPASELPPGLRPGEARGIGLGVAVLRGRPPSFETRTWCADTTIIRA